jgi:type II secretory pathway component GspD/PulD (secretin)
MKPLHSLAFVLAFALASTTLVFAQDKDKEKPTPPVAKPPSAVNATPLKVQVVIARYQGEKKISSMPYMLTMNANNHANLRMGTRIPVTMAAVAAKEAPPPAPIQYQDVGTNIDCVTTALDDGRFLLLVSLEDSSIYPDDAPAPSSRGNPSFRSFRASNSMVLKNGETGQFTTATDKVTGETVRVDVTLTVLK